MGCVFPRGEGLWRHRKSRRGVLLSRSRTFSDGGSRKVVKVSKSSRTNHATGNGCTYIFAVAILSSRKRGVLWVTAAELTVARGIPRGSRPSRRRGRLLTQVFVRSQPTQRWLPPPPVEALLFLNIYTQPRKSCKVQSLTRSKSRPVKRATSEG